MNPISLGLLGKNIGHSRSKEMYQEIYNQEISYTLFDFDNEMEIPGLEIIFKNLDGLSITSPYKRYFLNDVLYESDVIKNLNAINCIKKKNDVFFATNTDYYAIIDFLKEKESLLHNGHIVILGDGVMSQVTQVALLSLGYSFDIYSRKKTPGFANLNLPDLRGTFQSSFIINTCSRNYVFNGLVDKNTFFWDMNYNLKAHEDLFSNLDCDYIDGLKLLNTQAKHAVNFWNL